MGLAQAPSLGCIRWRREVLVGGMDDTVWCLGLLIDGHYFKAGCYTARHLLISSASFITHVTTITVQSAFTSRQTKPQNEWKTNGGQTGQSCWDHWSPETGGGVFLEKDVSFLSRVKQSLWWLALSFHYVSHLKIQHSVKLHWDPLRTFSLNRKHQFITYSLY